MRGEIYSVSKKSPLLGGERYTAIFLRGLREETKDDSRTVIPSAPACAVGTVGRYNTYREANSNNQNTL
jgi:hypothetical protein